MPKINPAYQPADNTRVAWNPQQGQILDTKVHTPPSLDITDNPMGYAPVVGDILQGGQALIDFSNGDWKKGLLNAALLVVPNVLEKPVKAGVKAIKKGAQSLKKDGAIVSRIVSREPNAPKQIIRERSGFTSDKVPGSDITDWKPAAQKWDEYVKKMISV